MRAWATALTLYAAVGLFSACTSQKTPPPAQPADADKATDGESEQPKDKPRTVGFARASRCGECHERLRNEWFPSAHARSLSSPAFVKALTSLKEQGSLCLPCHLPSPAKLEGAPTELIIGTGARPPDGVSCDACHTLKDVQVNASTATPSFDISSGKKYGPIPNPAKNYFHGMAKSELHDRSEICAPCHHAMSFTLGAETRNIPVVSDYSGWKMFGKDKTCQGCHMPSRGTEPVARGGKPRPDVPSHAFLGPAQLGKQIRLDVSYDRKEARLALELTHHAGHLLPSGYVDRRLVIKVTYLTKTGEPRGTEEQSFGIFLIDKQGLPAPFFRAERVKEDRRIAPGHVKHIAFVLPKDAQVGGSALIQVLAAKTAPELATVYGPPEMATLRQITYPIPEGRP